MPAVGGDIGILFPDEAFENTVTLDAFGELFLTPRISARGMLAGEVGTERRLLPQESPTQTVADANHHSGHPRRSYLGRAHATGRGLWSDRGTAL